MFRGILLGSLAVPMLGVLTAMLGMAIGFSGALIVASAVYAIGTLALLRVLSEFEARAASAPPASE